MVAPSLRALGTQVSASTSTPSFAAPAGAVADDVIVVLMFTDDGRTTVTGIPTGFSAASGSPQINDVTAGSPSHGLRVYYGRYSAVGTGPYQFTLSTTPWVEGWAAAIKDCITTGSPFEAAAGNTSGNTSVTTAPLVSATSTGTDRYALYAATNWTGGAWTPATGFTEQVESANRIITIDDLALPTAQTVSPQAVCAGNNRSNAWVGILLPTASGTSVPDTPSSGVRAGTSTSSVAIDVVSSVAPSGARTGSSPSSVAVGVVSVDTPVGPRVGLSTIAGVYGGVAASDSTVPGIRAGVSPAAVTINVAITDAPSGVRYGVSGATAVSDVIVADQPRAMRVGTKLSAVVADAVAMDSPVGVRWGASGAVATLGGDIVVGDTVYGVRVGVSPTSVAVPVPTMTVDVSARVRRNLVSAPVGVVTASVHVRRLTVTTRVG